jgi:hypothetical protein
MNELRGEFEVTVGGTTYTGKLSMNTLRMLCKAEKIELDGLSEYLSSDPLTGVCTVTYYAIKNKALLTGTASNLPSIDTFMAQVLDDPKIFSSLSETVLSNLKAEDDDEESKKA